MTAVLEILTPTSVIESPDQTQVVEVQDSRDAISIHTRLIKVETPANEDLLIWISANSQYEHKQITELTGGFLATTGGTMTGDLLMDASNINPLVGSTGSIGLTGTRWADGYFDALTATALTGALTGNASTATALATARNINGVAFDGTANIVVTAAAGTLTGATLAANVLASSLTSLGTIASLVATTADINGGTIDGTAIGGSAVAAGSFTTLTITQPTQDYLFTADAANLAIQGRTSATTGGLCLFSKDGDGTDSLHFRLFAKGLPGATSNNERLNFKYKSSTSIFELMTSGVGTGIVRPLHIYTSPNTSQIVLNTDGSVSFAGAVTITGAITGALTGNASTATALATARTIGGVSFDGTAAIVPQTIQVVDSTDATSSIAMFDSATGSLQPKTDAGLTYAATTGILTATGFAGPLTGAVTGNADAATALETARTIGGVSFDGTANIVPATITVADTADATSFVGLWESASGDLAPKTDLGLTYAATTGTLTATAFAGPLTGAVTGNADTATALATARNINGVAFDGTANITITAAAGTLTGATLNATVLASSLTSLGTIASLVATSADINGGTIDGTAIGGSVTAAGAFTTLDASGTLAVTGVTTLTDDLIFDAASANLAIGTAALGTTATDGFIYISTSAGTPTGVPTAFTGRASIHWDSTNDILYVYDAGWNQITGGGGSGDITRVDITGGIGLTGDLNTTSGDHVQTLDFDATSLTALASGLVAGDHIVVSDGVVSKKALVSGINLGIFNNDQGWTANAGTVTAVTGGVGITSSGGATPDIVLDLSELATSTADGDGDFFAVVDGGGAQKKLTKANIALSGFNNDLSEFAVSKLADGAARQLLQTDAGGAAVEWASNIDVPGTLDVTGAVILDSTLTVSGAGPNVFGGAAQGSVMTSFRGNFTSDGSSDRASTVKLTTQLTGAVGDTNRLAQLEVSGTVVTQGTDTNIGVVAAIYAEEPEITNNLASAGKPDVAATVYIKDAPTEGDVNAALYVAAGAVNFQGTLAVTGVTSLGTVDAGVWEGTAVANAFVADLPTSKTTSGTFADARISTSSVEQHVDREVSITVFGPTDDVTTGDGKAYISIPSAPAGYNLTAVHAEVVTAGTTGTTDIQIHNIDGPTADMLSTKLTIDSAETGSDTAAAAAVIDAAQDDVAEFDVLRIDIDAVSSTPPKGLIVRLTFSQP